MNYDSINLNYNTSKNMQRPDTKRKNLIPLVMTESKWEKTLISLLNLVIKGIRLVRKMISAPNNNYLFTSVMVHVG